MRNEVKSRCISGGNRILGFGVLVFLCVLCVFVVINFPPEVEANNVQLSNAVLKNPAGGKITVEFKLAQENPFGNVTFDSIAFSDYVWVFVKFSTTNGTDGSWKHATLSAGGGVAPVADNKGAFIKSSLAGPAGATFNVLWNYVADGVGAIDANTLVKVCSIEMVEIPTGSFYFNAGGIGEVNGGPSGYTNAGQFCYDGTGTNDGLNEVLIDNNTKHRGNAGWPNGYDGFYLAKYEISQQQFCDFLNCITATDAANRYDGTLLNTYGYTISYSATAPYGVRYGTGTPNRGCNMLSWDDTKAYLSWAALRPMTEMEFEKAARGTQKAGTNKRTYPWGNTAPSTNVGSVDGGTHTLYYANYNYVTGGYAPILVGWYLSQGYAPSATEATGASPYGIADLAGNVWEHLINCDWTTVPLNGNGTITPPASWPGAATGKGLRGGSWNDTATYLRVSGRVNAGWTSTVRVNNVGCRPARTK